MYRQEKEVFEVRITEYLVKVVKVDAYNEEDALRIVENMHDSMEIELDHDDFSGVDFEVK